MLLHNIGNYIQERYNLLKAFEGEKLYAYVDTEGIATIGIGLNIRVHGALVLQALGFDVAGAQLTGAAALAEQNYINQFLSANNTTNTGGLFNRDYPANNTASNQALATFNALLQQRAANPAYMNPANFVSPEALASFQRATDFRLSSTTVSENLFTQAMDGYIIPGSNPPRSKSGYEATLDLWVNRTGVAAAQPGLLARDNKERLALLSLAFNSRTFATNQANTPWNDRDIPTLLGKGLTTALLNDNRAEAWFEIRYGSNGDGQHASRRYAESDLFGLLDSGAFTDEGTKEVFRMYTKHRSEIDKYENDFPPPSSAYFLISAPVLQAKEYLVTKFGQGKTIDEIIVGAGLDSYAYLEKWSIDKIEGTYGNDLIFGEKGSDILDGGAGEDVIYGGEGNDMITGGQGNDYIEGGAGNDIYYINTGDGTDTIEDKEGNNRVIVNGKEIGLLIKQADGSYKNPDGKIKATIEGTDLVIYDAVTGAKIAILNKDFQDGDFGIRLLETPADPVTNNTIIGDLTPHDFDSDADGIQSRNDEWGNIITDSGNPSPNRKDTLYGETANDALFGGITRRQLFGKEVFTCVGN